MASLTFETLVGLGILTLDEELTPLGCFLEERVEVDIFTPGSVFSFKATLDMVRKSVLNIMGSGSTWETLSDTLIHRFVQYGIPSNPVEVYLDPLEEGYILTGCITLEDHAGITTPTHPRSFGMYLHSQLEKDLATVGLGMLGHLAFHHSPMEIESGTRNLPPRGFRRETWPSCMRGPLEPHVVWEFRKDWDDLQST